MGAGETLTFTLQYGVAHKPEPDAARCGSRDRRDREPIGASGSAGFARRPIGRMPVKRSLITLQALTEVETGGIIAAPTTSLPEVPGGEMQLGLSLHLAARLDLRADRLSQCRLPGGGAGWRDWLLRAAAGVPERLRTMYRSDGARHIVPHDVPRLPGWGGSRRCMSAIRRPTSSSSTSTARCSTRCICASRPGLADRPWDIAIETELVAHIEKVWERPDQGIWESRGPAAALYPFEGDGLGRRRPLSQTQGHRPRRAGATLEASARADASDVICREGFNAARNSFVQIFDDPRCSTRAC